MGFFSYNENSGISDAAITRGDCPGDTTNPILIPISNIETSLLLINLVAGRQTAKAFILSSSLHIAATTGFSDLRAPQSRNF